jgi:hypothetical protein
MSKAHLPPVPPAGRPKQGGEAAKAQPGGDIPEDKGQGVKDATDRNLGSQGRQGNIATNTKHQGFQQDR